MKRAIVLLGVTALIAVGCASFVKDAQKTLYATTMLADGGMQTYATFWKAETNQAGFLAEPARTAKLTSLTSQRDSVMNYSIEVGVSINTAQRALDQYAANVGTNQTTEAVVNALLETAVQKAGSFEALVTTLTSTNK